MRQILLMVGLSLFATGMEATTAPTPAACVYCYSNTCYGSSSCGRQCSCVVVGRGPKGVCVGSDYVPEGARVLE